MLKAFSIGFMSGLFSSLAIALLPKPRKIILAPLLGNMDRVGRCTVLDEDGPILNCYHFFFTVRRDCGRSFYSKCIESFFDQNIFTGGALQGCGVGVESRVRVEFGVGVGVGVGVESGVGVDRCRQFWPKSESKSESIKIYRPFSLLSSSEVFAQ